MAKSRRPAKVTTYNVRVVLMQHDREPAEASYSDGITALTSQELVMSSSTVFRGIEEALRAYRSATARLRTDKRTREQLAKMAKLTGTNGA